MVRFIHLNFQARKKQLKFARSKIHDWGVFAIEPIEAGDFVVEYVGELVRPRVSIRQTFLLAYLR